MMRRRWLLGVLAAVSGLSEAADHGRYYEAKQEGWFWREAIPEEAGAPSNPPPPSPSTEPIPTASEASPLSPQWLREQLPVYRDRALAAPTPENVRAYYYLQRHAMNMAEQFALTAQKVVMSDPMLDENTRRPLSTYGAQVADEVARENAWRVATKIASLAGLWYFYRSDCPFCHAQNAVLDRLRHRLGLAILPIALDHRPMPDESFTHFVGDQGQAQRLAVTRTPTLFLVRAPGQMIALSEGLVTDEGLLERMIQVAHEAGWITQQEFESTRATAPAPRTRLAQDLDPAQLEDPVALVELLRSQESGIAPAMR
jgi:conjugal transfer pilus assembly protein TraF